MEIGRTFSSLLSDRQFRARLHDAVDEKEFKQVFESYLIGQDKKEDSKEGAAGDEAENTFAVGVQGGCLGSEFTRKKVATSYLF